MQNNSQNRRENRFISVDLAEKSDYSAVETHEENAIEVEVEKIGIVTDCERLNVREAPVSDAKILIEIPALSEVLIDEKESTDAFYKICTASGVQGFCMKKFISVRH